MALNQLSIIKPSITAVDKERGSRLHHHSRGKGAFYLEFMAILKYTARGLLTDCSRHLNRRLPGFGKST